VALNYGGRSELVDAVNEILVRARQSGGEFRVDEQTISEHLYTADLPDPDLLIRTSGELRVSNFLLWQIAYSEIWVTDKLWPDFQPTDLLEAILDFQRRERRYGGLGHSAPDSEPALVGAGLTRSGSDADASESSASSLNKYSE
jgi:undecaprenyl diphosphate synthase